jgi:hypothetical protein
MKNKWFLKVIFLSVLVSLFGLLLFFGIKIYLKFGFTGQRIFQISLGILFLILYLWNKKRNIFRKSDKFIKELFD